MRTGDAKASSLMRWLSFYAVNPQEECVSIVLRLLRLAFPKTVAELKLSDGWNAVVIILEGFYETNLAVDVQKVGSELNDTLTALLELVLGAVVQCEAKERFINDILAMEDAVQADLMAIIEKVMAQGVSIPNFAADDEEKRQKVSPGIGSPLLYLSRNATLDRVKRENGVLKEENIHLAQELEMATKKFGDIEREREQLLELMQGLKEQVDADALRRERAIHAQYNERVSTLQLELDSTKAELHKKEALASKVPALSDEVDLLRPLGEKMKKVDSTVAKYKAKIDELSGAKDMLRQIESTNAELVERNLALESYVAKAAAWQRKLKEAKETITVLEFRVVELETVLAREREEFRMARAELETIQGALQESKALIAELQECPGQQATDTAGSIHSVTTIATGISELNPELMQKLTRLKYENAELKKQVDSETAARIDSLVDEMGDLSRLKKSFEKKYFDTQQTLQSTQAELKQTKEHCASIVAELQAKIREFREQQSCLEENVSAQNLETKTVIAARDRLAAELSDSTQQNYQLEQEISRLHSEISELQVVSEALTRQNKLLSEQCASLSRAKEDTEANLARQIECTMMQFEDINAEWIRFQEQKSHELEQLTSRIHDDKLKYDAERKRLETTLISATKDLERYQEQHSVSNADWSTREAELNNRIEELERLCNQSKQQEQALKSTIRSQLESNTCLVEKNKAMKADAVDKREKTTRLETTITRLESKVALLEKERRHFTAEDERKRSAVDGLSSYSSQLSTQVNVLATEMEKVLKENKDLHAKQEWCRCKNKAASTSTSAQNYYLSRIQQVEQDKRQVERKRRELLLVNAKLIQEQKQLHVKNVSLTDRIHELEESVNHWRLCDERRRTQEGQPSLSDAMSSTSDSNELPDNKNQMKFRQVGSRKRKLETVYKPTESSSEEGDSTADSGFTDAKAFFSKTSEPAQSNPEPRQRRFSHFITRNLIPDESNEEKEKRAECKQQ
ncbi:hypothetical protein L917_19873 [Phytophthora nicotianae]|uniref:HOOK N-terminal domain-containing protein n=1 Tax=Phytophthora nicotianae TaxID=4792 RepID=W2K512_PHYNI|nr:hypothetical protein L917_19873 [Phytophthora nicotianae]